MPPAATTTALTILAKLFPLSLRLWLGAVIVAFAVYSPVLTVMDTELDSSNFSSYTYFAKHQFQYGPEVVPMSGPYGYVMYGNVYSGLLFWHRIIAQLVCSAAFAALALWFFQKSHASAWRWLWLGLVLFLSPVIDDLTLEWTLLLAGLFLLQRPPEAPSRLLISLSAALLAFISLMKGTHLILAVATLGVVVTFHLTQKDWRRAVWIACAYAVSFVGLWLLAGQSLINIPSFIQGIRALTNGYNDAMALDEARSDLIRGLLAVTMLLIGFIWGLWHRRREAIAWGTACLFAGFTFVKWKHGFVRADGHIIIFHHYAACAAVFWFVAMFGSSPITGPTHARTVALVMMFAGIFSGLWIESARVAGLRLHWLATSWNIDRIRTTAGELFHPAKTKEFFDKKLRDQRDIYVMPLTQQMAGEKPIDLLGVQHGIIPLNGLNYRPRPMGGGAFNSYNAYLMNLNRNFIRDAARRPDYYLLRLETIDHRLAAQDDSLTLLELLSHYQPQLIERGHVLMKALASPSTVEPVLHSRKTFNFSEFVTVPPVDNTNLLLARFDIKPTLKGRVRGALYKSPLMFISLQGQGIDLPDSRRFIPSMTSTPFLLSPAIENNEDVVSLYTNQEGKRVSGFFIYSHDAACYEKELTVEFYTVPRPPEPKQPDIEELLSLNRYPVFNVTPESVIASGAHHRHLRSLLVQTLHAPGEIVWRLDGTEQEISFDFGLMPETYSQGEGNGVVFRLELRAPDQPPRELFRQLVDPARVRADRANLNARVTLPSIPKGSRLALISDPGEGGNNAWDWSYVTRIQLKRGYFSSARFPNFNREPNLVSPPDAATMELEDEKIFMMHLPSSLCFPLNGSEKELSLEYGFLPGAYTGEGRTAGADYVVELIQKDQPAREIFRRSLRPLDDRKDRGRQQAKIPLPQVSDADSLIVRIDSAVKGHNSWGWTYISRLNLD